MSVEQLLYAACGGLVSAVVFLFLKLQKRTDQMIQLALKLQEGKNEPGNPIICPYHQKPKGKKKKDPVG